MRDRLQNAPWWVIALVLGTLFGASMWLFGRIQRPDTNPVIALVSAVIAGLLFGLVMARWSTRMRRELREVAGNEWSPARERTLMRAVMKGERPEDPAERLAAARSARYWLAHYERQRRWVPGFFAVMTMLSVHLAVTESGWWSLTVPMYAAILVSWLRNLRRLRRRVPALEDAPG